MISRVRGTLLRRDLGTIEVMTASGVAYELDVPLTVYEQLPRAGAEVELRTFPYVRWSRSGSR
jgi:Holliday junction resolvasome RuvABC DNA-binding subunit